MQGKLLKYIHSFTFTYFLVSISNQARIKDFQKFFVDSFFLGWPKYFPSSSKKL